MTNKFPNPNLISGNQYLRRVDAAAYVRENYGFPCSRQLLAKLAVVGGGPLYRKAGRFPVYERPELDRWAKERMGPLQRTTSSAASPPSPSGVERQSKPIGSDPDQ